VFFSRNYIVSRGDFLREQKGQVTMEFMVTIILILGVFVFGVSIFQSRSDLNYSSALRWANTDTAFRIARNINSVNLLDDNALVKDYIYWNQKGASVSLSRNAVEVYTNNTYADAALSTGNIIWNVTDFNGLIYFRKINGAVIVGYD
jgi:uncharacterized protein (UPF0333 family)